MKDKTSLFKFATLAIAIVASFLLAFVIIIFVSEQPFEAMRALILEPFSNLRNFGNVIEQTTTFIFTGLAIAIMFQAGQFNIGAEGTFFMGALLAAAAASKITAATFIHPLFAIALGAGIGAAIMLAPAVLKIKCSANELVTSLMMNYAVFYFGMYLLVHQLRDDTHGALATQKFAETADLPVIISGTRINTGLYIAIIMVFVMYVFVYRTRFGYEIRVLGENPRFARFSGINVARAIVLSQVIGGMIAGMGGAVEMLGMYNRFLWVSMPGYGWDGVVVAILAGNKPQNVPLAAFFLAYLRIGSDIMARSSDIPRELMIIIQSVIILLISATALLGNLKQKYVVKELMLHGDR